jgi:hypothetical protein
MFLQQSAEISRDSFLVLLIPNSSVQNRDWHAKFPNVLNIQSKIHL